MELHIYDFDGVIINKNKPEKDGWYWSCLNDYTSDDDIKINNDILSTIHDDKINIILTSRFGKAVEQITEILKSNNINISTIIPHGAVDKGERIYEIAKQINANKIVFYDNKSKHTDSANHWKNMIFDYCSEFDIILIQ